MTNTNYEYGKSCEKCFTKTNVSKWLFTENNESEYDYEGIHHFCPECAKKFIDVFRWVTDCIYSLKKQ